MQTIHVVIESWGEYEDASERMVRGFTDPVKAEHHVFELKEAARQYWELRDKFDLLFNPVRQSNRYPTFDFTRAPKPPNGVKKANWPQSYIDAMKKIEDENAAKRVIHEKALESYCALMEQEAKRIFNSLGISEEDQKMFGASPFYNNTRQRDVSYTIEELEVE